MKYFFSNIKKYLWSYIFVLPMFLMVLVFTLYPLLDSVRYTFYEWNGIGVPKNFVGLKHYYHIAQDSFFWNAFKNTFLYTAILVPIQLTLALILATILNSHWLRGKYFFRAIYFSPVITSSAIVGIVISLLINQGGEKINKLLMQAGIIERSIDWLGDPRTAMLMLIAVGVWIGLGYPMIYFLAALQSIEPELYDAAKMDGASSFVLFWRITLPLVRPVGLVVLLFIILHSLRVFDIVQVMTRGGPYFATDVVGTYIYRQAFYVAEGVDIDSNLGYASAAALFMGLLVIVISILQIAAVRYASMQRRERGGAETKIAT